jgi:hypothetical protein
VRVSHTEPPATAAAAPARVIGVAAGGADQELAARCGFESLGAGIAIEDWYHVSRVTVRALRARMGQGARCGHRSLRVKMPTER